MSNNPRFNGSGCKDMVAYEAAKRTDREIKEKDRDRARLSKFLEAIFNMADLAGYHIEERIVIKDKKTGEVYR